MIDINHIVNQSNIKIPDIPGNYPKDYIDYLKGQEISTFDLIHKFKEVQGIILAIDLRNFTRTMDKHSSELMNTFLSDFFEEITIEIQKIKSGYVNKLLGDGLLAHFQDIEPNQIVELSFRILKIFQTFRRKFNLRYLGITEVISSDNYYLGTIGKTNYLDFTLIGKNINNLFRLLGKGKGDCIYITDRLLEKVVNNYVIIESGINIIDGVGQPILTHLIFRKKNEYEIHNQTILTCPTSCNNYEFCFMCWEDGRNQRPFINCYKCGTHKKGVIDSRKDHNSFCKNWTTCEIKWRKREEEQYCCHGCENFRNCFHNYQCGKYSQEMVKCEI